MNNDCQKVVDQVLSGQLSLEEGANALFEHVYKNKLWYGLGRLSEDSLHDFLVYFSPKFKKIITAYKKQNGFFEPLLFAGITTGLRIWKRGLAQKITRDNCLSFMARLDYEEDELKYNRSENLYVCDEKEGERLSLEQIKSVKKNYKTVSYKNFRRKAYRGLEYVFFSDKSKKILQRTCHVLALKSAYYIDDELLEKVSIITDVSYKTLYEQKMEVIETLKSKIIKMKQCKNCRDKSFFYSNKYRIESENLNEGSSLAQKAQERFKARTKMWLKKSEMLKLPRYSVVPSDSTVGRILGISPRTVRYILESAEKNIDNLAIKRYYMFYEDLLGKRKPEQKEGNE